MNTRLNEMTAQILTVFTEEVTTRQGRVTDTFHDGQRLFTRSVLPHIEEVRPGDRLQGGVALKATKEGIWLYPYLFRLVCRNGAIMAETLESRSLGNLSEQEPDEVIESVREGIEACCADEVFRDTVRKVRTACEMQVDMALNLLPMLSRFATQANAALLQQIMDRFFHDGDTSRFGLANAVTAVARDTRDPDLRWNLEEFGGGIAIGAVPRHPVRGASAARSRLRQAVLAG